MANEQYITLRGRLTNDVELRFTPSGAAVANFTIASNARTFDRQSNEWKDGEPTFWRCQAWRELGENVAESLTKGTAVIALAVLETRKYQTKDGESRSVMEAKIEAIGPDLRWATAKVNRGARGNGEGAAGQGNGFANTGAMQNQQQSQQGGWNAPASDPWATGNSQQNQQQSGGWNSPGTDEPPF